MLKFSAGIIILLLASIAQANASQPYHPTESEIRLLPPYCAAKFAGKGAAYENWKSALGPGFMDVHHYCTGLNFLGRYYRSRTPEDKNYNLKKAISDFNYMIGANKPGFSLLWEIYMNRGLAHSLGKQYGSAIADLKKAESLNPKSSRVYQLLADIYVSMAAKDKALEEVTEGLRQVPDSRPLKHRYDELGGKKPYPEPYARVEEKAEEKVAPTPDSESEQESTSAAQPSEIQPTEEVRPVPQSNAAPDKNQKSNPWCRFCPAE